MALPVSPSVSPVSPGVATRRASAHVALAALCWAASVVLAATALVLAGLVSSSEPIPATPFGFASYVGLAVAVLGFSNVGLLVTIRRPEHRIGWLFGAVGLLSATAIASTAAAQYAVVLGMREAPAFSLAIWLSRWLWAPTLVLVAVLLFLLFPDERLAGPTARVIASVGVLGGLLAAIGIAFYPASFLGLPSTTLFGLPALATTLRLMAIAGLALLGLATVASVGLLLLRFRRSTGDVRQQLKWFTTGASLLAGAIVLGLILSDELSRGGRPSLGSFVAEILAVGGLVALPVSTGIAILKYRLYHIDHLINRALVYGAMTAILAGIYAASIKLFQSVFVALTGNQSDAAVVLTTLVLVTAFTPLKTRLEALAARRLGRPTAGGMSGGETAAATRSNLSEEIEDLPARVARLEAAVGQLLVSGRDAAAGRVATSQKENLDATTEPLDPAASR